MSEQVKETSSAKCLYIDISYLVHWQGNLTGIPRMINEIASRYSGDNSCKFIVWANETRKFYEVDFAGAVRNRGKSIEYLKKRPKLRAIPGISLIENASNKALRIFRAALSRLHKRGIPLLNYFIYALDLYVSRNNQIPDFLSGDTLFVPMGEWANPYYIDNLRACNTKGVKLIQTIHDMLPIVTPQYSGHSTRIMRNYCQAILPISSLVLAVSENTKKDVSNWLQSQDLYAPPIRVFRHGDDFAREKLMKPVGDAFIKSGVKGDDYLLCVGTIEARKNHTLLYYVYKLARNKNIKLPKLIVVGRRGWLTDNIIEIITQDPDTKDEIVLMTNVNDEELGWLYSNCLFTLYPSFYEGWGIPIAESIAHGKPCISSNTSSMPEIAGNLIDYFSPLSPDECLRVMNKLLRPEELDRAHKKIKKYSPTSWNDTFKRVDSLIRGV